MDPNGVRSFCHQNSPLARMKLRSTQEIPTKYRSIFRDTPYFNILQSSVLDDVLYGDNSIVVCAPTGSGKTMLFEVAIVRMLIKCEELSQNMSDQKVVYMAPIKALCSQRCQEWQEKFASIGLQCVQLTGDSSNDDIHELQKSNIILTTPEKWDHTTRRWHTNMALISQVRLFLIDEVHLLNDESRGATMEAAVSRMKTKRAYLSLKGGSSEAQTMRFVGVSATIPNVEDIAQWLSTPDSHSTNFTLPGDMRPVKLDIVVLGYPCYSDSEFKFDITLNYKLKSVIDSYSAGKPTLVFCSTRKSVEQAANQLKNSSNYVVSEMHQRVLNQIATLIKSQKLRENILNGVAYHHAGLDMRDRQLVEKGFISGHILVLLSTSTLAMGVNLPAHLVVVKSTSHYVGGVCEEYSQSEILQMIGRAGRPQYDTSAIAVIMTKHSHKSKYENLTSGTNHIESSLHKHLIEHLNAEIVLGTIPDTSFILEWVRSTFLYIRAMANPTYYGYQEKLTTSAIEKHLHSLCMSNLDALVNENLVTVKEMSHQKALQPTLSGRIMAQYCIAFDTMKNLARVSSVPSAKELVSLLADCKEYQDITLRVGEKATLNQLNKSKKGPTIRYPLEGKIKNAQMKVNCLLQSVLGNILLQDFALQQDITKIFRTAIRVSRCFMELQFQNSNFQPLYQAVKFSQSIKAKMWENSPYVCRQLPGIGPVLAASLAKAGVTSFADAARRNPRDIELIVNRHPPFGNVLLDAIRYLPKYDVSILVVHRQHRKLLLQAKVSLSNNSDLKRKQTIAGKHSSVLLIGLPSGSVILKQRLSDVTLLQSDWSSSFEVAEDTVLSVAYCSQDWVGLDVEYNWCCSQQSQMPLNTVGLQDDKTIETSGNDQSRYFAENHPKSSISKKSNAKASAKKSRGNVTFSSKNILNWKDNITAAPKVLLDVNDCAMVTARDTSSPFLESSDTIAPLSNKQLPNLEDLDEQEATCAISMYMDMARDGGDNLSEDVQLSTGRSTNSLQLFPGHQVLFSGKSARKRPQFQDAAVKEYADIVPNFDLGLEWNYLGSPTNHKNNSKLALNKANSTPSKEFISFDDSFDEAINQESCEVAPDDCRLTNVKRRKINSSGTAFVNTISDTGGCSKVSDDFDESFCDYSLTDSESNSTNALSFNSVEVNLTETPKKSEHRYCEIVKSPGVATTDTLRYGHLASAVRDVHTKEETASVKGIPFAHPLRKHQNPDVTSFYENRAKRRALTRDTSSGASTHSFPDHLPSHHKNHDGASSLCKIVEKKPVKKANGSELAKANDLLNNILEFFDL